MKSGSLFLTLVLLIVLAIPLFAGHALGNTVGESSAMSIPGKEEVPVQDVTAPHSEIIGIPPKPIPVMWLPAYLSVDFSRGKDTTAVYKIASNGMGGVRRIKSGRH